MDRTLSLQRAAHLSDVPLIIRAELRCRTMTVDQILSLEPGYILRTDRAAGDNVDVHVSGRMTGTGEIIVIENTTGVRFTDFGEKN